jgi:hypothetical protein
MSLRKAGGFILLAVQAVLAEIGLLAALPAGAQYPGQVTKSAKDSPELRSIAVLEWTGEEGDPKASRLVPVAVLDAGQLQDGGIYLARPEPLALTPEVEYELEENGKPVGLFDIKNAGQEQGSWVGFGAWKPMPIARPRPSARDLARSRIDDDAQSDEPVLHRKHHAGDAPAGGTGNGGGSGSSSGTGADSGGQAQASDPDRPTLHKKSSSDSTSGTSASPGTGSASSSPSAGNTSSNPGADSGSSNPSTGNASSNPGTGSGSSNPSTGSPASTSTSSSAASDSDRPTLHKKDSSSDSAGSGSGTSSAPAGDADRPVLKKSKKSQPADIGHAEALPDATDPDRPRLKRGKSSGNDIDVAPSLMGFPPDLQQAVAVSDARTRPEHLWNYVWSNPDDEAKMKSSLEDTARDALGLNPPPPKAASAPKRAPTKKTAKPAPPPPPPAPLVDEQFRVFELAYGSGATLVLTAHTDGPAAQQKFVTLVAQPDLYGNVLVLLRNVTDGAHLDEKPRMRLVDAVDAMADNRGELLFELRGATQRQFALYRVLRGQAEKLFVNGGGEFGTENRE